MSVSENYPTTEAGLIAAIDSTPIIDNHAHPLLKLEHMDKFPLLAIATEANGDALESSRTSMAHIRAVNQLSRLLNCDATWEAVSAAIKDKRQDGEYEAWLQRCMEGIETVLVDDGLGDPDQAESYQYFDQFTRSESKRIIRIEYEATLIIRRVLGSSGTLNDSWADVVSQFDGVIKRCLEDDEVVGFKSVICYRTGLDIGARAKSEENAFHAWSELFEVSKAEHNFLFDRLSQRGLNEYFVHRLAQLIRDSKIAWKKPVQFHTGLGDNDITLTISNPSYLQGFIKEYPEVPIVLLHASYPFTREAGYLAAMYSHVYADIGEVFPFVNREGQIRILKHILELCPVSKILWSTDGHWFPETYLLAVEQMRVALKAVLCEYTRAGDMSYTQAMKVAEDMLFNNSNKLYNLGLTKSTRQVRPKTQAPREFVLDALSRVNARGSEMQFLRMAWMDMTSTARLRAFPMRRVWDLLEQNKAIAFNVVNGVMGLLQNDIPVDNTVGVGERTMVPDWSSLRVGPRKGHMIVRGDLHELTGEPSLVCPRTTLKKILACGSKHGLEFALGFEIELRLFRREDGRFSPVESDGHAWCVGKAMDSQPIIVVEEAIAQLDQEGIHVEIVHPESAHGQFEIVLPKRPALEAVDTLLYAREVIAVCASSRGYKMTLHPRPSPDQGGTAAHVHMSISTPNGDRREVYEPFYAGILKHIRAIMAFTCSSMASYDRIQDSIWTGGTWVAWGTQNRETPLRKISGSHWEVKCMDGTANPYLALAALLGTGVQGVVNQEELNLGDCSIQDSAYLSDAERLELGIGERLPRSLDEAMEVLRANTEVIDIMGKELVELYLKVKDAEMKLLNAMETKDRTQWMIERY